MRNRGYLASSVTVVTCRLLCAVRSDSDGRMQRVTEEEGPGLVQRVVLDCSEP